jgi:hypothetical protein
LLLDIGSVHHQTFAAPFLGLEAISSSSFSITVWSRRAPIFSIWPFTSAAIRASARMPPR